jgi:hypothetical protein
MVVAQVNPFLPNRLHPHPKKQEGRPMCVGGMKEVEDRGMLEVV